MTQPTVSSRATTGASQGGKWPVASPLLVQVICDLTGWAAPRTTLLYKHKKGIPGRDARLIDHIL